MKVCEIFKSIQGEGPEIGTPTLFIRLSGCNAFCDFCDSKYSWKTGKKYTTKQLVKVIESYEINHITWTGGEPTLQIEEIRKVIAWLGRNYKHSIETNGSLIHDMLNEFNYVVVSPKKQLKEWFIPQQAYIKMVCEDKKDVEYWLEKVIYAFCIDKSRCYFMPEGTDEKQLKKNSKWLIKECMKHNIKFAPRIHINIYGKKRGV